MSSLSSVPASTSWMNIESNQHAFNLQSEVARLNEVYGGKPT